MIPKLCPCICRCLISFQHHRGASALTMTFSVSTMLNVHLHPQERVALRMFCSSLMNVTAVSGLQDLGAERFCGHFEHIAGTEVTTLQVWQFCSSQLSSAKSSHPCSRQSTGEFSIGIDSC